jgi:phosphoribosylanthranilate isomerase
MRPHFPISTLPCSAKICGLTRLADAISCHEAGAQAIGINFWPKSKRYHPLDQAQIWLGSVPESMNRVAVLVNATMPEIDAIWASGQIDTLQFHGDEPDSLVLEYKNRGIPCIRALAVRCEADLEKIASCPTETVLLDAYQPGVYGGSGTVCDWELARKAVLAFTEKKIILSGGLTPENAARAVYEVRPAALDVASGVESAPGIKDPTKISRFLAEIQSTFPNLG